MARAGQSSGMSEPENPRDPTAGFTSAGAFTLL